MLALPLIICAVAGIAVEISVPGSHDAEQCPSDRGASRELRRSAGPGRLSVLQKMDMGRPDRMGFSAEGHGALMHAGRLRAGRMRQPNHAVLPM